MSLVDSSLSGLEAGYPFISVSCWKSVCVCVARLYIFLSHALPLHLGQAAVTLQLCESLRQEANVSNDFPYEHVHAIIQMPTLHNA